MTDNPHSDLSGHYWRLVETDLGRIHLRWACEIGLRSPMWADVVENKRKRS